MIPVQLKSEPKDFDNKVRQNGLLWLSRKGIDLNAPAPPRTRFKQCWTTTIKELWEAYSGICAYYAFFIEYPSGAVTTDHFVPKLKGHSSQVYEWKNLRLACFGANRRKGEFTDVLDPFSIEQGTFIMSFPDGKITSGSKLNKKRCKQVNETIERLKLNAPSLCKMRMNHFEQYLKHRMPEILEQMNPFVFYEAKRQGLL